MYDIKVKQSPSFVDMSSKKGPIKIKVTKSNKTNTSYNNNSKIWINADVSKSTNLGIQRISKEAEINTNISHNNNGKDKR
jgi:hypothetical protein